MRLSSRDLMELSLTIIVRLPRLLNGMVKLRRLSIQGLERALEFSTIATSHLRKIRFKAL